MPEIALECNPDEILVKSLGYPGQRIVHQPSKGEVINYLRKNPGTIGVVDEDPYSARPTYFSRFKPETPERFGIESLCIANENTRLIVIKPRLEDWVLRRLAESKINANAYSLPNKSHDLHKIINSRLRQFENLLMDLIKVKDPGMLHLKKVIDKRKL